MGFEDAPPPADLPIRFRPWQLNFEFKKPNFEFKKPNYKKGKST